MVKYDTSPNILPHLAVNVYIIQERKPHISVVAMDSQNVKIGSLISIEMGINRQLKLYKSRDLFLK